MIAVFPFRPQVITLNVNFDLKWCDDLLKWNSTEQACVKRNRSEIFFGQRDLDAGYSGHQRAWPADQGIEAAVSHLSRVHGQRSLVVPGEARFVL